MQLTQLVTAARAAQASDIHLEPGQAVCFRIRGQLRPQGAPISASELLGCARELIGEARWGEFLERRSCDLARTIGSARCRINIFCTSRGIGIALRVLPAFEATLDRLNLHPEFAQLARAPHGLVIVCGATGSGKSSTLAALIHELNAGERRHIVTIESPIEFALTPRTSFIRQREVGRDTPTFEQGLYDAMREDPDVLMVGEMRDPETMRLTLNAAETGHLVLTTLHSSTAAEALQRIVGAFPAEIQSGISAQLADCLVGVVCQRLRFFPRHNILAPECEVLMATQAVRAIVRQGQFSKLQTAMETGGSEGSFTFSRYREWLEKRTHWFVPSPNEVSAAAPLDAEVPSEDLVPLAPARPQRNIAADAAKPRRGAVARAIERADRRRPGDPIGRRSPRHPL